MTVLNLVVAPDPRLLTRSEDISIIDESIKHLGRDMIETMRHNKGIGLAAVQVGKHLRMLVVDIPEEMEWTLNDYTSDDGYKSYGGAYLLINPKITKSSKDQITLPEGCLSLPGQSADVTRPASIVVEYLDNNSEKQILKADKWLGRCIQHEIDHLNGILYIQHLSKMKYDMAMKKAAKNKSSEE